MLDEKGEKKEVALMHIIQKYIVDSKKVLFEGDGYSDSWEQDICRFTERRANQYLLRVEQIHHDGKNSTDVGPNAANDIFRQSITLHGRQTQRVYR